MPISTENTPPVLSEFIRNLQGQNLSPVTIKNYTSDLAYFFRWLNASFAGYPPHLLLSQITPTTLNNFHHHLSGSLPPKTANRRLSALRNFCRFLFNQNYTSVNSATGLQNIQPLPPADGTSDQLLHQFAHELKLEGAAPATITNYISDAKKFLQDNNLSVSTLSPATAKRHLSSWKKFRSFLHRQTSSAPQSSLSAPLTPTSLPTTHYLSLLITPLVLFIITFIVLILLTPPPQLLTPTP